MKDLRELRFEQLEQVVDEVASLLRTGYDKSGNWTLGQTCRHLRLVQDPSIDGYPRWISLFAFLRPVMRRWLLPKVLSGNSPRGIPTAPMFVPSPDLDDSEEATKFIQSVRRFQSHTGPFVPHPGFGRMGRDDLEKIHAAHAAHHLRFLEPSDPTS